MMNKNKTMMDVGRVYNVIIKLQKKVNEELTDLDNYEDYIDVSAETRFTRSRLYAQANTENTKKYTTFIIRNRNDIDETMRIIYKNEPWQIESIIPLTNDRLYLQIEAYKYTNDLVGDINGI